MPARPHHHVVRAALVSALLGVTLTGAALVCNPMARASAHPAATPGHAGITIRYLGEKEIPFGARYGGTTVGGLSAISYDRRDGLYYIISDDRSQQDPARFYTARLALSAHGLAGVQLTGTHPWLRRDGSPFPPTVTTPGQPQTVAPDPEGIAIDPRTGELLWSSEGERIVSATAPAVLEDPWVRRATTTGRYVAELPLPPQEHMNSQQVGPRQNQTLEGISFTPDGRGLYSSMEDPLFQDGADPTPAGGALTRFTQFDATTGVPVAQYAYPLSAFFTSIPAGDTTDTNGVSDILALGGGRFLVLERASVYADENWKVRIFLATDQGASNVLGLDSLGERRVALMRKRLLVDLSDVVGLPRVDNVEGLTLGPRLPDGRRSLVLVSDNNFSDRQVTQFIAFSISGL